MSNPSTRSDNTPTNTPANIPSNTPSSPSVNTPERDVYASLKSLNITLPQASVPAAAYVMAKQSGNLVHVSGHIAKHNGQVWVGQLGVTMTTAEGQRAARQVAIDLLATLEQHLGSLHRISRFIKLTSLVNSSPHFTEQHLVTNGCSEFLVEVFGEAGKHARSAFGVAQLPLGACVEIECIVEVQENP